MPLQELAETLVVLEQVFAVVDAQQSTDSISDISRAEFIGHLSLTSNLLKMILAAPTLKMV